MNKSVPHQLAIIYGFHLLYGKQKKKTCVILCGPLTQTDTHRGQGGKAATAMLNKCAVGRNELSSGCAFV